MKLFVLSVALIDSIFGQNTCVDPNQTNGVCIPLSKCSSLVDVLRNRPVSAESKTFLAKSQCGWQDSQPLVCCIDSNVQNNTETIVSPLLPSPGEGKCGIYSADRIISGERTHLDEHPWLALLEYSKPDGTKGFHCGGVLISLQYVLTTASCVKNFAISKNWTLTGVRLGEWNLKTVIKISTSENKTITWSYKFEMDCESFVHDDLQDCADSVQNILIDKKIVHENYEPASFQAYNDIALLRLAQKAEKSDFVQPICLPFDPILQNYDFKGVTFEIAGWGQTEWLSESDYKIKGLVRGTDYATCNKFYENTGRVVGSNQICTGGKQEKESCKGDAGSGLMREFRNSRNQIYFYLEGLASYGPSPCNQTNSQRVFTRVTPYLEWIQSKIEA